MEVADAETHRSELETEIRQHASRPVDLLVVDDVATWMAEHGGSAERDPVATAVVDAKSGDWAIVLRRSVRSGSVASVLDRIELGGFSQAKDVLTSPLAFLKHTVLHELAHLENAWGQEHEDDCDEWAFARLCA